MRALIFSVAIATASATAVMSQTIATMPPSTYPETGVFCGFLRLCPVGEASE